MLPASVHQAMECQRNVVVFCKKIGDFFQDEYIFFLSLILTDVGAPLDEDSEVTVEPSQSSLRQN